MGRLVAARRSSTAHTGAARHEAEPHPPLATIADGRPRQNQPKVLAGLSPWVSPSLRFFAGGAAKDGRGWRVRGSSAELSPEVLPVSTGSPGEARPGETEAYKVHRHPKPPLVVYPARRLIVL
jgi:hypothetical protein